MSQTNPESTVEIKSILDIINEDIGPIPSYLINLFNFLGYNTYDALRDFSFQDVNEIERFAREELCRLISDNVEEKKNYFGAYHCFPKLFRILPGHKKLILSIPTYMKGAHTDNGCREHFNRLLKWNHPKIMEHTSFKRSIESLSSGLEDTVESDLNVHHTYNMDEEEPDQSTTSEDHNESALVRVHFLHTDGMAGDSKRVRLAENSSKTQNDEHRIRDAINRWLFNVESKLNTETKVTPPIHYSIVFYHRPEEGKMSATIECCMCRLPIGISSHRNKNGSRRWLISNFMRHVKKTHFLLQYQHKLMQQQQINIEDIAMMVKKEVE